MEKSANPVARTDYIGKKVGLLQRMLSAWGHGVSGLASRAVRHLWSASIFRHLQSQTLWQPCCLSQLCHSRTFALLGGGHKRRNYESAKSRFRFDGNAVFVRRTVARATGEDRLRSQCRLLAIQDLLVGTG